MTLDDYDYVPVADLGDPMQEQETTLGTAYIKIHCYMGWLRARAAAILAGTQPPSYQELLDEISRLTGKNTTGLEVTEKTLTTPGTSPKRSDEPDWDV